MIMSWPELDKQSNEGKAEASVDAAPWKPASMFPTHPVCQYLHQIPSYHPLSRPQRSRWW